MLKDLKVVFMGTPSFGKEAIEYLIEHTNVVLVVTQPDKMVGRKKVVTSPYIKKIAIDNKIPVFQPIKIRTNYEEIKKYEPDLIITAAYGQIVPKEVLDIPRLGCINLHGSILPFYRGAAPIQWSILNGDKETGVSLMYMDEKMDTGDVIDIAKIKIDSKDNFETLYNKLGIVGKEVLEKNLINISNGTNNRIKQDDSLATYARMLNREDELINFDNEVDKIINQINGVYPNGYINIAGNLVKILEAVKVSGNEKESSIIVDVNKKELLISGKDGIISLKRVKPNGKSEMEISSYLNGINKEKILNLKIN